MKKSICKILWTISNPTVRESARGWAHSLADASGYFFITLLAFCTIEADLPRFLAFQTESLGSKPIRQVVDIELNEGKTQMTIAGRFSGRHEPMGVGWIVGIQAVRLLPRIRYAIAIAVRKALSWREPF